MREGIRWGKDISITLYLFFWETEKGKLVLYDMDNVKDSTGSK